MRPTPARSPLAALTAAVACVAVPLGGACTTTSAVALQPARVAVSQHLPGTIRVEATGSSRRGGLGPRAITGEDLAAAVRGTLLGSHACDGVVEQGVSDHLLRVEVLDLWSSEPQLDMEATLTARWTLFDGDGRVATWQEVVKTAGKATTFDSGMVEDRARMAIEDATRKNLEAGVARLTAAAASLPTPMAAPTPAASEQPR